MNSRVIIREFKKEDKDQILAMFLEFGQYFAEIDDLKRSIVGKNYAEHFYQEMLKKTTQNPGKIYVAEEKDQLVGFIAGNVTELTPQNSMESIPCKRGRILEFFVREDYRGQGIGTKLINRLEDFFKNNQCDIVNVEVFAPNQKGLKFYKKFGFQERNYDLIKILR